MDVATYVPTAPVRRRIADLEAAGWSRRRIAVAAWVAPSTVTKVAKPRTRWCSRIVARVILAVEP
jgi:lambda repressor-like predicted transcriptional regulator